MTGLSVLGIRVLPVFCRSGAHYFLELPVEVYLIGIAAQLCDLIDGQTGGEEQIFGVGDPGLNQVMAN